jgi:ribonuclease HII
VGRGALAGPLVVAGVIFPEGFSHPGIRDSKTLSERQRERILPIILDNAVECKEYWIDNVLIDQIGIQQANQMAFVELMKLLAADRYLIDGNLKLATSLNYESVIKGESHFIQIAAASIVAKVKRDQYMAQLTSQYPFYRWNVNKGYGSSEHITAMQKYGLTPYHRKSFQVKKLQ